MCTARGATERAQIKERPVVHYVDLRVYGKPYAAWRGRNTGCAVVNTGVFEEVPGCWRDHRIAAKACLLTTRAAKWATEQVGTGRTRLKRAGRARLRLAHRQ